VARVWAYIDGDKFKVRIGDTTEELNTIGADAPEVDEGDDGECYANEASDAIRALLPKKATVYLEKDETDRDGKNRILRYVWVPGKDGKSAFLLNERLIKEGYASFKAKDGNTKYDKHLKKAENAAKKAKAGLWGICGGAHEAQLRCEEVPQEIVEAIATGILPETGATLRGAQAVKSKDFEKVWFVAADLEDPGLDGTDQIGVWATNNIQHAGGGLIFAVDGFAQQFTDWGHGDTTDAHITMADDGADEATRCVRRSLAA
jgi:endonuclease YncB( thermonuclease family)